MGAGTAVPLSGRDDELQTLLEVVRLGTSGSPQAVLVHGEAGVGKTALVRAVVEQAGAAGAQVLWGQALRFGAVEAAYHPLVLALEGWLAGAGDAERAAIVEEIPAAALVLPSLGAAPAESGSHLMTVVDALIGRVVARGPTVLVVDDVQWADPSTWDALAVPRRRASRISRSSCSRPSGTSRWDRRASSAGWGASDACRGRTSWPWPGSDARRPSSRSRHSWEASRRPVWSTRCTSVPAATRTSPSSWSDGPRWGRPSCRTSSPTSSAGRCSRAGAPSAGSHAR